LVCEKDQFSWDNGIVWHKINWLEPRGQALAVYSHVKYKTGQDEYEVMTMDQVKAIQKRSKAGQSGPWQTDFDEMAKKTVIRRHSKKLTLSADFHDAVELDQDKIFEIEPINLMPKTKEAPQLKVAEPVNSFVTDDLPDFEVPATEQKRQSDHLTMPITEQTIAGVLQVCMNKQITKPALDKIIRDRCGVDAREKMTEAEGQELIAFLNK
jgi:hypothetical protein